MTFYRGCIECAAIGAIKHSAHQNREHDSEIEIVTSSVTTTWAGREAHNERAPAEACPPEVSSLAPFQRKKAASFVKKGSVFAPGGGPATRALGPHGADPTAEMHDATVDW
jgi:hypothetical protein